MTQPARLCVIDASVIVKWVLPDREGESDIEPAIGLLDDFQHGTVRVIEPPHWLAEVAAVLVRLRPEVAATAVELLHAMEVPIADGPDVYRTACDLSARLGHHLFDTLYHAVALETPGASLVTADEQYYRKARAEGAIVRLGDMPRRSGVT